MLSSHPIYPSRLDTRTRLIAIFVPVVLAGVTLNPIILGLLTANALALLFVSRVTPGDLVRAAVPLVLFCAITLVMHLLFTKSPDAAVRVIGPFRINDAALMTGLLYCWRILLFGLIALCFVRWIAQQEFVEVVWRVVSALGRIGIPALGVGMALTIAVRFIPQIFAEHRRIEMAQRLRGASRGGTGLNALRRFIPLLVPTVVSTLRRIDITADALTVRAWGVQPTRTFYRQGTLRALDAIVLSIVSLIVIVTLVSVW
jgi:energy-coupling factor transport system permease protein